MTLTIKDPPEVTSQVKAGSPSQNSENNSNQSPRSNPVCLEVPITIRSLPGERGNGPGAPGPIREEGRTVIVFDNGGVLRITSAIPVGQTVILSNQQGRDVVCKVAAGRNLPNIKGYIEVEFIEPVNDFWRIHQSSEPSSAPPAPFPVAASPQLVPAPSPQAPTLTPRTTASETEPSLGSAPSFEDIAGLVSMSPAPASREKKIELAPSISSSKSGDEQARRQPEAVSTVSSAAVVPSVFGPPSVKPVNSSAQEAPTVPLRSPTFSTDLAARGKESLAQIASVSSSAESRGRMPLIVGGAALVLLGFGAGLFLMHRGSTPVTAPTAIASQPSAQPPTGAASMPAPVSSPEVEQPPIQTTQQISTPAPDSAPDRKSATSDLSKTQRTTNTAESKQQDRSQARDQAIPNLKMGSPKAPKQDLSKFADGSSLGEPDLTATAAPGGAPAGVLLPSVARSENQPAPPPSAAPRDSPAKSVSEARLISSTRPSYPDMAKLSKVQGSVVVAFSVDAKGNVVDATATSGPILLRQAAVDAVKQWKYSPALIDGKPTSSHTTVRLDFRLS